MAEKPEKLVTIAAFSSTFEATLARFALDNEGIEVVITGDKLPFAGVSSQLSAVELKVFESDAQRALDILEKQDWEKPPEIQKE